MSERNPFLPHGVETTLDAELKLLPFAVGDWVKYGKDSILEYEIARIEMFAHGLMVGIYDEPPSDHIDYLNPDSLVVTRKVSKSNIIHLDFCKVHKPVELQEIDL